MVHADTHAFSYTKPHLLGIEGLTFPEAMFLLSKAREMIGPNRQVVKKSDLLTGRSVINLFYEASTRTQSSFEIAAKRLGADVVNMAIEQSSVKKGETLLDTAMTLNAMAPDLLIVRHSASGAATLLSRKVDCPVINAGDGAHEHPTQALLDAMTIFETTGRTQDLAGLKVVICGDIKHSRVARSNILLLNLLGADVHVVAPRTLLPAQAEVLGVSVWTDLGAALVDADVVMMLRIQNERMQGSLLPSQREFHHFFGLDDNKLMLAKDDVIVMHPGPMNRGVEIASSVADGPRSVIKLQVEMGVAVRMALIEHLILNAQEAP